MRAREKERRTPREVLQILSPSRKKTKSRKANDSRRSLGYWVREVNQQGEMREKGVNAVV